MTTTHWDVNDADLAVETIPWPGSGLIRGLAASPEGLLYMTRGSSIYKMPSTGTFELYAGNPTAAGHADGHRLTQARFHSPNGLCVTNTEVFVCDNVDNVIRSIFGDEVTTYAGEAGTNGHKDGPKAQAKFDGPSNAVMFRETLFITDMRNHRIRLISADGIVSSIGCKAGHDDGAFAVATFDQPSGLCVSPNNTIVVAESGSRRVRSIDMDDWSVTTLAGGGAAREDGAGLSAGFGTLSGICASSTTGKIYLVDFSYNRIRCIDSEGQVSTLTGTSRGEADGPLQTALLLCPDSCCMTPNGTLYWTEYGVSKLRRIKNLSPPIPNIHYSAFAGFELLIDTEFAADVRVHYQNAKFRLHSFILRMSNPKMTSSFIQERLEDCKVEPKILAEMFRLVYGAKRPVDEPRAVILTYAGLAELFLRFEYAQKWLEWCKARIWDHSGEMDVPQLYALLLHFYDDEVMRDLLFPVITSRLKSQKASDVVEHRHALYPLANKNLELFTSVLFQITGAAPNAGRPHDLCSNLLRTEMKSVLRLLASNLSWHRREKGDKEIHHHKRSRSGSRSLSPRVSSPLSMSSSHSLSTIHDLSPPTSSRKGEGKDNKEFSSSSSGGGSPSNTGNVSNIITVNSGPHNARNSNCKSPESDISGIHSGTSSPTTLSPPASSSPLSLSSPYPLHAHSSRRRSGGGVNSRRKSRSGSRSESPELAPIPGSPSSLSSGVDSPSLLPKNSSTLLSTNLAISDQIQAFPAPNFHIFVEGHSSSLHVHDWVLYARWGYFRRMMDAGLSESNSRRMTLPSGFAKNILLDLIKFIYTGSLPHTSAFTPSNSLYILEHAEEYDLVDPERLPRENFAPLIIFCRSAVFHPLTISNVLKKLKFISDWGSKKDTKAALKFIGANLQAVLATPTYRQDISDLPGEICREILLLN